MSKTITIEVSERAAARLAGSEKTMHEAQQMLEKAFGGSILDAEGEARYLELQAIYGDAMISREDIVAIGQGIADADAGRIHDGKTVIAKMREKLLQIKRGERTSL